MANETQDVSFNPAPTVGSCNLSILGATIAFSAADIATPANIAAALNAALGAGSIVAGTSMGAGFRLVFGGALAGTNLPAVVLSNNLLTRGTGYTLSFSRTQTGRDAAAAVAASGLMVLLSVPLDGMTVTIDGVTFTFRDAPLGGTDVDTSNCLVSLATAINANCPNVTASNSSVSVAINANTPGAAGNSIGIAASDPGYWTIYAMQNGVDADLGQTEYQLVTLNGSPDGGALAIACGSGNSGSLAWNVSTADLQAALNAVGGEWAAVTVGGSPGSSYTIAFPAVGAQTLPFDGGSALTHSCTAAVTTVADGYSRIARILSSQILERGEYMFIALGGTVKATITVRDKDSNQINADGNAVTAKLRRNGVDNAAMTVTHPGTGDYLATLALPTGGGYAWALGDYGEVIATATQNGKTDSEVVLKFQVTAIEANTAALVAGVTLAGAQPNLSTTAAAISARVQTDLATAHGSGSWLTGDVAINIGPISASTVSAGQVSNSDVVQYQFSAFGPLSWAVVDDNGNPVNLQGDTLTFRAYKLNAPLTEAFTIAATVSGTDHNILTVVDETTGANSKNNHAGEFRYQITNDSDGGRVRARGALAIKEPNAY